MNRAVAMGDAIDLGLKPQGKACEQWEERLKRQPFNREARLWLIQFSLENGEESKAQSMQQVCKTINPEDVALKH